MTTIGIYASNCSRSRLAPHALIVLGALLLSCAAYAQEPRYSYFEIGVINQDQSLTGTQVPIPGQVVDIATTDGSGVQFLGSLEIWNGVYAFAEYGSADPDVGAIITNAQGQFTATDEYDLTTIRGGVGYGFPLSYNTHVFAEVSWDSLDYDFGSFAGEDFDTGDTGLGAALGVRTILWDDFELRASGRYTSAGTANLTTLELDDDTLFAVGASYMFIRGLSLTADYETGEIDTWSIGFRLDLDEY
jgi:hypothetical protein